MVTNIYYAFMHPYLMYGIEICANTYVTYVDKLVKINNKLLRILQNQPLATPVSQLYTIFNLLSIDKLHVLRILLLVFICLYHSDLVPSIYSILYYIMRSIITILDWVRAYIFVVQEHLLAKNVFSLKAAHFGIDYHHHWKSPLLL